jgi:hypothetical protein
MNPAAAGVEESMAVNTSFINPTQVNISVATDVTPDTWTVKVTNPNGKQSNVATFQVGAPPKPVPSISNVSPKPVTGSNSTQTITIKGANFVSKPTVTLTEAGHLAHAVPAAQVTFVSNANLRIAITTTTTPNTWTVQVTNPDGQPSNALTFQVIAPTASNPTSAEVVAKITQYAQKYGIPSVIIAAVISKGSPGWKHFDSGSNPIIGPTGDVGLMQINVMTPFLPAIDLQQGQRNDGLTVRPLSN